MNLKSITRKNHSARLVALFCIAVSGCASYDKNTAVRDFDTHWEILMPAHGVYLGDERPACTNELANTINYRRDHSLMICVGEPQGWVPLVLKQK